MNETEQSTLASSKNGTQSQNKKTKRSVLQINLTRSSVQKAPHFEQILQVHVDLPCRDPLNPPLPLVLSLRSFFALWHRYSSIHGASQESADSFYDDLLLFLNQEKEGTSRSTHSKKNYTKSAKARTSWANPAPRLLDILARTFGITYERYCSPLNFSPVFSHGSTIGGHTTSTGQRVVTAGALTTTPDNRTGGNISATNMWQPRMVRG